MDDKGPLDPAGSLWFSWKRITLNVEETPDKLQNAKIWISYTLYIRAILDPEGSLRNGRDPAGSKRALMIFIFIKYTSFNFEETPDTVRKENLRIPMKRRM